jgi:hypothetical protein
MYGSYQLSGQQGYVISIPNLTEVVLNINSIGYNNFNPSPAVQTVRAQITAIGDVNTGYISSTGVNIPSVSIPGSYINISPL